VTLRLLEPWRTRVLWASLCFNLFAVVALATPHLWFRPPPGPPSLEQIADRMARHMSAPDAERFRAAMSRDPAWFDQSRSGLAAARAEVVAALRREPFDPSAMTEALAAMQDRLRDSSRRFDQRLVAALATVSPDGRDKLADNFRRGPR
jgi:uncharacterized membrane protein